MTASLGQMLDKMLGLRLIAVAREAIYEPEAYAFGGPDGMNIAHRLFHADSRNILHYHNQHHAAQTDSRPPGRRELSVLLCSALMRGAGQDWFEQGDIWNRVAGSRPAPPGTPLERLPDLTASLRRLMTADTGPASTLTNDGGALAYAAGWTTAFHHAGADLGRAAHDGPLSRGLRDILAHHVIFHWNRIGLDLRTQSILAAAATTVVFGQRSSAKDECADGARSLLPPG